MCPKTFAQFFKGGGNTKTCSKVGYFCIDTYYIERYC